MGVRASSLGTCAMGLITCEECGRQVSDQAVACPQCGRPGPQLTLSVEPVAKVKQRTAADLDMKYCPFCCEQIASKALFCPLCRSDLSKVSPGWQEERERLMRMSNVTCPHCRTSGRVHTTLVDVKRGISDAKATAAIFTLGQHSRTAVTVQAQLDCTRRRIRSDQLCWRTSVNIGREGRARYGIPAQMRPMLAADCCRRSRAIFPV